MGSLNEKSVHYNDWPNSQGVIFLITTKRPVAEPNISLVRRPVRGTNSSRIDRQG
jgi:hypothetical protein